MRQGAAANACAGRVVFATPLGTARYYISKKTAPTGAVFLLPKGESLDYMGTLEFDVQGQQLPVVFRHTGELSF